MQKRFTSVKGLRKEAIAKKSVGLQAATKGTRVDFLLELRQCTSHFAPSL